MDLEVTHKILQETFFDHIGRRDLAVRSVNYEDSTETIFTYNGEILKSSKTFDKDDKTHVLSETTFERRGSQDIPVETKDFDQLAIGEAIIGNLNEDGYLCCSSLEIAQLAGIEDVPLVECVLSVIQNFEPLGIAARDLKECLLIQARARCPAYFELFTKIIYEHLNDLGTKRYHTIAKNCNVPLDTIKEVAQMITKFDPRPARNYRSVDPQQYIIPDIMIQKDQEKLYQIHINHEHIPHLRINPLYRKMLSQSNLNTAEKDFIREKLNCALQFIKSIELRGNTLRRIAQYILEQQKQFFEESDTLIPMTLKDVALAIDRSESTISRAINKKHIDTPKGLFPLKFFFSQGIPENNNGQEGTVSANSVKEEIRWLIKSEEKSSPLSDQHIQAHFKQRGMRIARRTVSKYRQSLKILPSYLRKINHTS